MCSHKCVFVFWHTQGCAWVQCIFSLTQLCVGVCVCSHVRLTWVWPLLHQAGWLGVFFLAALSHKQVGLGLSVTGASFAAALLPHCHMSRPGRSARLGCVVTSQARPGRSTTQAGPVVSQHYLCRSTSFAALSHEQAPPTRLGSAWLGHCVTQLGLAAASHEHPSALSHEQFRRPTRLGSAAASLKSRLGSAELTHEQTLLGCRIVTGAGLAGLCRVITLASPARLLRHPS